MQAGVAALDDSFPFPVRSTMVISPLGDHLDSLQCVLVFSESPLTGVDRTDREKNWGRVRYYLLMNRRREYCINSGKGLLIMIRSGLREA
jgi:hypothetical protein